MSARTPRDELAEATEHGGLYLRRLLRAQLALYLLPGLQHVTLLGIPLPIVAVLWPPFPLFVAIALIYTRRAEALEDAFRELVEPPR